MSNQLQITGGAKVRNLEGVLTGTSGVVNALGINVPSGIPQLDSNGKILVSQLPNSVMEYKGTWNAATNTPTLVNGTGNQGDVYLCSTAGTVNFGAGPITFAVGDQVIYSGSIWQKASGATGTVTSVAMTTPTGLTVTGSPITTAGTLAISVASGYTIPLSTQLVPTGGTTGQILAKNSNTAYDTTWIDNYTEQLRDTVKAAVAINKGQAVYISGANGTNQIVSLASNVSEATSSKTLGLAMQNFAINDIGQIITEGLLAGIDTSTATAGDPVWLGVNGNLIFGLANKPVAPAHLVYIGVVTRVQSVNGEIYVKIQNGFELQELHNVSITSPTNNQGIFYNSSNSLWENKSIATALGYTPANAATTINTTSPLQGGGDLSANRTFSITQATTSTSGYLSSTDWNTFNGKQAALSGIGFVKISGTTISYDNNSYLPLTGGTLYGSLTTTSEIISLNSIVLSETGTLTNYSGNTNFTGTTNGLKFKLGGGLTGAIAFDTFGLIFTNHFGYTTYFQNTVSSNLTLTLPSTNGTLALTSQLTSGTVTSVGLSSATSGVTIGSSPITTSGTITLAIATASGSQQGLLSSTDWTTFNNKQNALTNPVTGTGTTNYHAKFTGSTTLGNSLIYDNGSNVTINNTNGVRVLNIYSATADNHLAIYGSAPSVSLTDTPTSASYQAKFGLATASGQFVTGSSAGDFVISCQNGSTIWAYNSAEVMRINVSGNLGINQSNPTYKLDVNGTGRFTSDVRLDNGAADGAQLVLASSGFSDWNIDNYSGNFRWYYGATERMRLTNAGNLGIGTSSPNAPLHILGANQTNGTAQLEPNSAKGTISSFIHYGTTGDWYIRSASTSGKVIINDTGGNVGIGTSSPTSFSGYTTLSVNNSSQGGIVELQSNGTSALRIACSTSDSALWEPRSVPVLFATANTERMRITSGGNVGIGTTSPNAKLQVGTPGALGSWMGAMIQDGLGVAPNGSRSSAYIYSDGSSLWGLNAYDYGAGVYKNVSIGWGGTSNVLLARDGGNVGIGTTSPSTALNVVSNDGSANRTSPFNVTTITATSGNAPYNGFGAGLVFASTHYNGVVYNGARIRNVLNDNSIVSNGNSIAFDITSTRGGSLSEAMRIDYTGNVGIGTSSPANYFTTTLTIDGSSSQGIMFRASGTDKGYVYQDGSFIQLGSNTGGVIFKSNDTERMRITGGGTVLVNTTTDDGYKFSVYGGGNYSMLINQSGGTASYIPLNISHQAASGDNVFITFNTSAGEKGKIYYNRGLNVTAYSTTSDYRIKAEIEDFNAIDIINNLKPKKYRIRDAENKHIGFIAHELQEYFPQAVGGIKDEVDEKGNPVYQNVDYSQLTALLTKAIQEQQIQIEELKALINK